MRHIMRQKPDTNDKFAAHFNVRMYLLSVSIFQKKLIMVLII